MSSVTDPVFFASTPRGLEPYLAAELQAMGASSVKQRASGVMFGGGITLAYKACLWSRVANRVLWPLDEATVRSPEELYHFIQQIDWSEHLDAGNTLAVDFFSANSTITHSQYGAQKVKDAVVDQFRDKTGSRPSVDRLRPDLRINVYLYRNRARVAIDLSGVSLHQRGYRQQGSVAPLKENLAAAILLAAQWPSIARKGGALVDPMCGSGTLLIEAAMIASNTAPGLLREYFGFLRWKRHRADIWESLLVEARHSAADGRRNLPMLIGSDRSTDALAAAEINIENAGFVDAIRIFQSDIAAFSLESGLRLKQGLLISNPPYGQRIDTKDKLGKLFTALGTLLRREFAGWQVGLLTGTPGLAYRMRLPVQTQLQVSNGDIACKFLTARIPDVANVDPVQSTPPHNNQPVDMCNMFANRLRKNHKHLRSWAKRNAITAYRVYDADIPEFAVAVDIYDAIPRHVVVQEYQAPAHINEEHALARMDLIRQSVPDVLDCSSEHVHIKIRRKQKGTQQYQRTATTNNEIIVSEGRARFIVNLVDYLDTGLFLDHRKVREFIANNATGKRFLNLFGYTGTATVHAILGGASSSLTLDMSNTYLAWAQRNLHLNGCDDPNLHRLHRADCIAWLEQPCDDDKFDLILLDPPTFSNSARMSGEWDVQRDHANLLRLAMTRLAPHGLLIFSNNFRRFKLDKTLQDDFVVEDRSAWSLDKDFQRAKKIHQCWFFRNIE